MPFNKLIQKVDGQVRDIDLVLEEIRSYLESERNGAINLSIKRAVKPKSNQQVKTIFGLMIAQTIIQCNDKAIGIEDLLVYLIDGHIPKGQAITTDFLHALMYTICPTCDEDGRRTTLSKMSTKQASDLFERFRMIMAPLGIDIPDPRPDWKDHEQSKNI